jgi:hypothetical protein
MKPLRRNANERELIPTGVQSLGRKHAFVLVSPTERLKTGAAKLQTKPSSGRTEFRRRYALARPSS